MLANLLLDSAIIVLLLTTIGYCWNLSRKIAQLRQGKQELSRFVDDFNDAIGRAGKNINELRALETDAGGRLYEHIQKARLLANDLAFLMNKGESVADALEHYITTSRSLGPRPAPDRRIAGPAAAEWERMLTEHMPPAREKTMPPSKKQALDQLLSQIAARKAANALAGGARDAGHGDASGSGEEGGSGGEGESGEETAKKHTLAGALKLTQALKQ